MEHDEIELQEADQIVPDADDVVAPDDESVDIGFADDVIPAVEDDADETPLVKKLRKQIGEEAKAKQALARALAEKEVDALLPAVVEKPKRPSVEDADYSDEKREALLDAYEVELAAWNDGKAQREREAKEKADAIVSAQVDWTQRFGNYTAQKAKLAVPDFDVAEEAAKSALTTQQQSMIVRNVDKPAEFIYALGKNAAKLKEVAALKDADRFTAAIVRLEGKMTVNVKAPPPPEKRLPVNMGGAANASWQKQLDAAEARYEKGLTGGSRDEIAKIRKAMKTQLGQA